MMNRFISTLLLFLSLTINLTAQNSTKITNNSQLYGELSASIFNKGKVVVLSNVSLKMQEKIKQDCRNVGIDAYLYSDFVMPGVKLSQKQITNLYKKQDVGLIITIGYSTAGAYDYTTIHTAKSSNGSASVIYNTITANSYEYTQQRTVRNQGNSRTDSTIHFYDFTRENPMETPVAAIISNVAANFDNEQAVRRTWKKVIKVFKEKKLF